MSCFCFGFNFSGFWIWGRVFFIYLFKRGSVLFLVMLLVVVVEGWFYWVCVGFGEEVGIEERGWGE